MNRLLIFLVSLIQNTGDNSSKRFLLLIFTTVVMTMWVIMSFKAGELVDIGWGPVSIIGALAAGVTADHFTTNRTDYRPTLPPETGNVSVTVNK